MLVSPPAVDTLTELFDRLLEQDRPDLLLVRSGGEFRPLASSDFGRRVYQCGAALASLGVGRGDRVGLVCSNRPEWHVVDFACHLRGAVLVPLFSTLTPARVRFIFADSGCTVACVEGYGQLAKLMEVRDELPELAELIFMASQPEDGENDAVAASIPDGVHDFEELLASSGDREADRPGPEGPDAIATIIYTSGTTGVPKGVMLSHGNFTSNVKAQLEAVPCLPSDRSLSVLPLCHVFERTLDYCFLAAGAQIAYGSPQRLAEDYLLVRPTIVAGVPRLFERFRAAVLDEVTSGGEAKLSIFRWAEKQGMRRARADREGESGGLLARIQHLLADVFVCRKVRAAAGGRIRHFISGGAALDPSLNWWFEAMGLRVLQGYGLTESSPVISVNLRDDNRIGTVGPPIPGVEVKIAQDGEILTRGPHVMKGYWKNPEATAEVLVDGWLHTGDVGALDADGYLTVTDRKKHLLVTSTGKNVAPQPLENALSQSAFVEQLAVVGDGRRFIAGLIVPDFARLRRWAAERDKKDDPDSLCADPEVNSLIRGEIDRLQADFAPFERVRGFRLVATPFSIEEGTLTPTLKAVRRAVEEKYADLIEEIYLEES